jgi:hypothetical protein
LRTLGRGLNIVRLEASPTRAAWIGRALFLLAVAALAAHQIFSFDVFWHLRAGEEILRTRGLPAQDPFSYTSTIRWMNHEWLSHVLLALSYRVAGFAGLVFLQAVIATAITWTMLIVLRPRDALACLGIALFGGLLALVIEPRAQMFYWCCFAATLVLCVRELQAPSRRIFWTIPLGILGANLHGGNPTSMALLAVLFVAAPSRKTALLVALGFLTTFINPHGYHVHSHFLEARHALPELREWMPLLNALALRSVPHGAALLLAALALVRFFGSGGLRRSSEPSLRFFFMAFLLFAFVTLHYARFATEWAFISVLLVGALPRTGSLRAGAGLAAVALLLLAVLTPTQFGFCLASNRFPQDTVAYLRKTLPPGPMFNSYNFGGYLLWAYPQERVFIDGRAFTVYSESHFQDLLRVYERPDFFRELERRYDFRLAVLQRQGRGAPFLAWLRGQPDWQVAYEDPLAVVLTKAE